MDTCANNHNVTVVISGKFNRKHDFENLKLTEHWIPGDRKKETEINLPKNEDL